MGGGVQETGGGEAKLPLFAEINRRDGSAKPMMAAIAHFDKYQELIRFCHYQVYLSQPAQVIAAEQCQALTLQEPASQLFLLASGLPSV